MTIFLQYNAFPSGNAGIIYPVGKFLSFVPRHVNPTCDLLLKGLFPGIHLDELDAVEDLVHGANTTVRQQDGFVSELADDLGH